jgi:metal-responsive CopG/Arc/MetJ family transcriptional regulator
MTKTTISLPDRLKRQLENAAKIERRSQAEIIREAIEEAMRKKRVPRDPRRKPRIPLIADDAKFPPDLVENIDEYLTGFGDD